MADVSHQGPAVALVASEIINVGIVVLLRLVVADKATMVRGNVSVSAAAICMVIISPLRASAASSSASDISGVVVVL